MKNTFSTNKKNLHKSQPSVTVVSVDLFGCVVYLDVSLAVFASSGLKQYLCLKPKMRIDKYFSIHQALLNHTSWKKQKTFLCRPDSSFILRLDPESLYIRPAQVLSRKKLWVDTNFGHHLGISYRVTRALKRAILRLMWFEWPTWKLL